MGECNYDKEGTIMTIIFRNDHPEQQLGTEKM